MHLPREPDRPHVFGAHAVRVKHFADGGLITGVAIVRYEGDTAQVDSFLLSCRVIGRGVEFAFWPRLFAEAKGATPESAGAPNNVVSPAYCWRERPGRCSSVPTARSQARPSGSPSPTQ